jgi:hypothetical protein
MACWWRASGEAAAKWEQDSFYLRCIDFDVAAICREICHMRASAKNRAEQSRLIVDCGGDHREVAAECQPTSEK